MKSALEKMDKILGVQNAVIRENFRHILYGQNSSYEKLKGSFSDPG